MNRVSEEKETGHVRSQEKLEEFHPGRHEGLDSHSAREEVFPEQDIEVRPQER